MGFVLRATGSHKRTFKGWWQYHILYFGKIILAFMREIDYSMQAFKGDICIKTGVSLERSRCIWIYWEAKISSHWGLINMCVERERSVSEFDKWVKDPSYLLRFRQPNRYIHFDAYEICLMSEKEHPYTLYLDPPIANNLSFLFSLHMYIHINTSENTGCTCAHTHLKISCR